MTTPPPIFMPPPPRRPPLDPRRVRRVVLTILVSLALAGGLVIVLAFLPSQRSPLDDTGSREWKNASDTTTGASYLALTPMLHVTGDYKLDDGDATLDLRVSNLGSMRGTVEVGGEKVKVLTSGKRSFARASESFWSDQGAPADALEQYGKHWVKVDPDFLGVDFAKKFNPSALSSEVYDDALAAPVRRGDTTTVNGHKATAMRTDNYTAYVADSPDHQVLALQDDNGKIDIDRVPREHIDEFMDDLEKKFQDLKKALDSQVTFTLDGEITLAPCSNSGCTANVTMENTVSSSSPYVKADQPVHAAITITMTLDGSLVQTCEKTVTMKPNGTGETTCSASYYIPPSDKPKTYTVRAEALAVARAVVTGDIKKMIADAADEAARLDDYPDPEDLPTPRDPGPDDNPQPTTTPSPSGSPSPSTSATPSPADSSSGKRSDCAAMGHQPGISYGGLQVPPGGKAGRATGAEACYDGGKTIANGTGGGRANPAGRKRYMDRGHLIAYSLGGSNKEKRNFVPLYHSPNQYMYTNYESIVKQRAEGGETIFYRVVPVYTVHKYIPCTVTLLVEGDQNTFLYASIINAGDLNGVNESGCR